MYFASRLQAGRVLAARLKPEYYHKDCAVLAINDGGAVIGAQVAMELQCRLMLLTESGHLIGAKGAHNRALLQRQTVIIVSDGLFETEIIDEVHQYLQGIDGLSLLFAVPLAGITAVNRMHALADKLECLHVLRDHDTLDNYYNVHDIPEHQVIVDTIQNVA